MKKRAMSNKINILVNGSKYQVEILSRSREEVKFILEKRTYSVEFENEVPQLTKSEVTNNKIKFKKTTNVQKDGIIRIISPIPGLISSIAIAPGQEIKNGDLLLQIEAMKMQNSIFAEVSGRILSINVSVGDEVAEGYLLVETTNK